MSIKELVVVIAIMAGMVLGSIPLLTYLQKHRREKEMSKTVQSVEAAIATWHYGKLMNENINAYPEELDSNDSATPCTRCFDFVLVKGLEDPLLYKMNAREYMFSINGNHKVQNDFSEKGDYKITYKPNDGKFDVVRVE